MAVSVAVVALVHPADAEPAVGSPADLAMQTATAAGQRGDWRAAVTALDEAINADPGWADAYYMRAVAHTQLSGPAANAGSVSDPSYGTDYATAARELELATADYRAYLRIEPNSPLRDQIEPLVATYETRRTQTAAAKSNVDAQVADARSSAHTAHVVTLAALGTGVAFIAGGVIATVVASGSKDTITAGGLANAAAIDSQASTVRTEQGLSYAAFALGGALVLFGAGLYLFGPSGTPAPKRPTVGLDIARGRYTW